jgi:Fic family protein
MAIRHDGDWEGWLRFFLRGVAEVSRSATSTARAILTLREDHRQLLATSTNGPRLLDYLFLQPLLSVRMVEQHLKCTFATASKLVDHCVDLGLLREITGQQRNRLYRYEPYLALFEPSLYPFQREEGDRTEPQDHE